MVCSLLSASCREILLLSLFYSGASDLDDCNSHLVHFSSGTRQIRCFSVGSARCR